MLALLTGGAVSLLFTLLLTPLFIRLFHRLQWGQFIRDDGPASHHVKRGTATMGGVVVIAASVLGYLVGTLATGIATYVDGDSTTWFAPKPSALLVLFLMVGLGGVGFLDDYLKTRKQQSLGLGGWAKIGGQILVATAFALLALQFPQRVPTGVPQGSGFVETTITPASPVVSIVRDWDVLNFVALFGVVGGTIVLVLWVWAIVTSTSNGVNVADGLDGLATGASIFAIGSYIVIGFWQYVQACPSKYHAKCYVVSDPLALTVVAACITGALIGFLWWNTSPAQIFMGDTGSLGLGGALAALAIFTRTELLLVFTGGLFVIVTGSVILQRAYFKITRGKRIFLMSPLHHHFELKGWAEVTVVVRFWIIAGLLAGLGVGLFYLEWLSR